MLFAMVAFCIQNVDGCKLARLVASSGCLDHNATNMNINNNNDDEQNIEIHKT